MAVSTFFISFARSDTLLGLAAPERHLLLDHRRLAIRVQQLKLVEGVDLEREGGVVVNAELGEVLENLL